MPDDTFSPQPQQGSQKSPWFTKQQSDNAAGLSTTPDDADMNIILNKIADDMGGQSDDLVAALDAIAAAINAKPSA